MKTIIRTLTTIALLSTIQCGWGTVTSRRWNDIKNSNNSTLSNGVYKLKDSYSIYEFYMSASQPLRENIKLSIPENVEVRNITYSKMCVESVLEIENNGSITNLGSSNNNTIQTHIATYAINSSITFSGSGAITNDTNGYIITSAENSSIAFSGSGDITNGTNGYISTSAANSRLTFSGGRTINNYYWISTQRASCSIIFSEDVIINNYSSGYIFMIGASPNSRIEFTENSSINNNGKIYTNAANSSIIFSGGNAETPQMVTTSAAKDEYENPVKDDEGKIIYGQIYFMTADSSMTIGKYSILSFGDYEKFYSDNSSASVTLNGAIEITSYLASVDITNMNISSSDPDKPGTIDMSKIQEYSANVDLSQPLDLCEDSENNISATFTCGQSQQLPDIKLPFNCQFGNIDLSNAAKVYYTVLKIVGGLEIDDNKVIKRKVTETHGDYASNSNLGVILPKKTDGTIDADKLHITTETQGDVNMSLSDLVSEKDENDQLKYNKPEYYFQTKDLDDATHNISEDTSYNFGFIGTTPIKISGNGKAIFNGDNSTYGKNDDGTWNESTASSMELPDEVEFGANNSLFWFTQTYGKGTFSAGNFTNTIPAGMRITFTNGFTLGKGHTLIVSGTLIG